MAELTVVCGASGGLGPAVATHLVERGDQVVAVAAPREKLEDLQQAVSGVTWEQADLTDREQTEQLWGRIDQMGQTPRWLVNLTGGYRASRVLETSEDDYRFLLRLNLDSCWWSCRQGAARIAAGGGGGIVNISARQAREGGVGSAAYAVSKAAVLRFSQVLAAELKPEKVRVNVLLPTLIDTPANRAERSAEAMRSAVSPEAVAQVIGWLCSEASGAITGASLTV
ncbi:MAG TPA: SDR family oxidoreductase [Candidatus Dormibacteraeota bacterium]|nr:SDR family oxidoreductase [Candidatus Dormibacteraeota bacterium]